MIYLYNQIASHKIEILHNYLDYFYRELFSGKHGRYDSNKLFEPRFLPFLNENYRGVYDDLKKIQEIYTTQLDKSQQNAFKQIYRTNIQIKNICDGKLDPFLYDQLPEPIRSVILELYGSEGKFWALLSAQKPNVEMERLCGTLKEHYAHFRIYNYYTVCPFCGVDGLLNEYDKIYKDDYDHFLPKSLYPFVSVLFDNLFPACGNCNRKYKLDDILFTTDLPPNRRTLYYPYQKIKDHKIEFIISSNKYDLSNTQTWILDSKCYPNINANRKEAWLQVYRIQSRYMGFIAKDSNHWKDMIVTEYHSEKKNGKNFNDFKQSVLTRFDNVYMKRNGTAEKCFHEFLLNDSNFEDNINGSITF